LAIIDFIGFAIVEDGGLSLLEEGFNFNGCFKRELFVISVVVVVVVRLGNCETDLVFLLRLPFGVGNVFIALEEFEWVVLLRRTVAADDVVLLDVEDDDELVIKR
jgi:uncharacterized membrane protein